VRVERVLDDGGSCSGEKMACEGEQADQWHHLEGACATPAPLSFAHGLLLPRYPLLVGCSCPALLAPRRPRPAFAMAPFTRTGRCCRCG
jgi:hypothetical protein